ncbi:uncharacterized protein EDB91DRAFT_1246383 [Suillus paluster]|uniref:uncharacterized protein n=1 Tax=Suillus paluster TaxID=48578 RepID=UPI001B886A8A|nr:uncharacterized protein EDB91DRAFT_1246383 [Suillus paluster]KAG1745510.1 hypothetical protein EDB91DRAFT_1246383 [Suillus paluster]
MPSRPAPVIPPPLPPSPVSVEYYYYNRPNMPTLLELVKTARARLLLHMQEVKSRQEAKSRREAIVAEAAA